MQEKPQKNDEFMKNRRRIPAPHVIAPPDTDISAFHADRLPGLLRSVSLLCRMQFLKWTEMLPGHVMCGYRVCGYDLCGRICNGCATPEWSMPVLPSIRLARCRYKAAVICAEFLWTGSLESKKPDSSGFPWGCHCCRGLLSAYSLQPRAGLILAVIVTAGVAVPAAGCVGAVVLRVILLWLPDRVNDEPDDQNDRGDDPDPYAA